MADNDGMTIDWREMFKNYVRIVEGAEGVDFMDHDGDSRKWTDDERAAIAELMAEKNAEDG